MHWPESKCAGHHDAAHGHHITLAGRGSCCWPCRTSALYRSLRRLAIGQQRRGERGIRSLDLAPCGIKQCIDAFEQVVVDYQQPTATDKTPKEDRVACNQSPPREFLVEHRRKDLLRNLGQLAAKDVGTRHHRFVGSEEAADVALFQEYPQVLDGGIHCAPPSAKSTSRNRLCPKA